MKKYLAIGIICILSLSLVGCEYITPTYSGLTLNTTTPETTLSPLPSPTPSPFVGSDKELVIPLAQQPTPEPTSTEPPATVTFNEIQKPTGIKLLNAEVIGKGVKAGSKGEFVVTLENSTQQSVSVDVLFMQPVTLREGFSYIGSQAERWVTASPNPIVIKPESSAKSLVTVTIPESVYISSNKVEFWLSYKYTTGGFVNYNLNQRWLLEISE